MTEPIIFPLPSTRAEWLALRQTGIGGSDVAPILGLSPWRSPYQVWEDKTGRGEDQPESPALYWGRLLEDPIRQAYADRTGLTVVKPDCMYSSAEHPFMHANLDGIASDGRIVEFKTSSRDDAWGEEGTDEIPEYYMTQVQHYLYVMGATRADVAVLFQGRDFRIYTVEADPDRQTKQIIKIYDSYRMATTPKNVIGAFRKAGLVVWFDTTTMMLMLRVDRQFATAIRDNENEMPTRNTAEERQRIRI